MFYQLTTQLNNKGNTDQISSYDPEYLFTVLLALLSLRSSYSQVTTKVSPQQQVMRQAESQGQT